MKKALLYSAVILLAGVAPAVAREWSDPTGTFKIEAEAVRVAAGKVFLQKPDNKVIEVELAGLSPQDLFWLQGQPQFGPYFRVHPELQAKSTTRANTPVAPVGPAGSMTMAKISVPAGFTSGEVRRFPSLLWAYTSVAFSPNGALLAAGKMDSRLMLFDIDKNKLLITLEKLDQLGQVKRLAFTPDGKKLLAGGSSGRILVWEASSRGELKLVSQFVGHSGKINSITISADSKYALSGSEDKSLRYWELDSGREVHAFEEFRAGVKASFLTPNGRQALGSDGDALILFDLQRGVSIQQMKLGSSTPQDVEISPNGQHVVLSDSYTVRMFNIGNGVEAGVMENEQTIQWAVGISPDSRFIASCGNAMVSIWSVKTGKRLHVVDLSTTGYVKSVAFSPDGLHLTAASGNAGQELQVFRLPELID
ncbi:SHD1 domain-containing protein [Lignipirellula cremea]|uniref:WD domain, G-beta repeat n=1 Tax=Lignipirellula cremea TaxID=2528010 RepID=A0A518DLI0_9BACT|nr:SHD1 domain-containing protein [Lignipirellula cremea]QDU92681.1 WD domain, G-beta repeat [Lignipirellula cremea]